MMSSRRTLFWAGLFAVAMAYLEATVVVYLRMIYYPEGFDFPLVPGSASIITIELGREAATIVMLVVVGIFCGRSKIERFAMLMYLFGIWDIFYYIWLWVQIGWPPSLITWDILFLIPTIWTGPVIAPVLVSIAMIWAALWIVRSEDRGITPQFPMWAWGGEILAGLIIIISFIWDFKNISSGGYPNPFRWDIFLLGWIGGILLFFKLMRLPHNLASDTDHGKR